MTLGSTLAKNAALDACYGDDASSVWPATVYLAFFHGDPTSGGTELTGTSGVSRIALANTNTNFAPASGGTKANASQWSSTVSSGAWANTADHWALFDASSSGNMFDTGQIVDSGGSPTTLTVGSANVIVIIPIGDWVLTQSS